MFLTCSVIYAVVQIFCCVLQKYLNVRLSKWSESLEAVIPDLGFIIFNILTAILLIAAIQKFRQLTHGFPGLCESKLAVYLHLSMFFIENLCMLSYIVVQLLAGLDLNHSYDGLATWVHIITNLDVFAVQLFIAYILFKLSKPPMRRKNSAQEYVEQRLAEMKFSGYNHKKESLMGIAYAMEVNKELAQKYEAATEETKSEAAESENIDARIFYALLKEVAEETNMTFGNDRFRAAALTGHWTINSALKEPVKKYTMDE